jgi:hypothetical protein
MVATLNAYNLGITAEARATTTRPAVSMLVTTSHPSLYQHPGPEGQPVHPNLGRLVQPRSYSSIERTAHEGIRWAADNDCFQGLNERQYLMMLDRIAGLPGCEFVTVPDVVGDAAATRRQFDTWAPTVRATGQPVALVLQDGQADVGVPWDDIDAVFVGGSDDFKDGPEAAAYAQIAQERGKWVHWGRVSGKRRFNHIIATGAHDSIDGSKWARWRKTYLDLGLGWCATEHAA